MKNFFLLIFSAFLLSSCGSLTLSPQACRSSGQWGISESSGPQERKISAVYYVMTMDKEIRLRDLLKDNGVACQNVKKMRVEMSSVFFVKRVLSVYITE